MCAGNLCKYHTSFAGTDVKENSKSDTKAIEKEFIWDEEKGIPEKESWRKL